MVMNSVCVFVRQVLIIIKYVFQFAFIPWNDPKSVDALDKLEAVFSPPYIFGIQKKDTYAVFDITLLFCVFIHRSVLKVSGVKDVWWHRRQSGLKSGASWIHFSSEISE